MFKEPWDGGKYIVNGDTTIANEKLLREFYEANVANRPAADITEFTVHLVGGLDSVWSTAEKGALTYCVSDTFGARYTRVVADMQAAAAAWEAVADLDFIHVGAEDGRCNAANASVVFDVRPVDHGQYLARAFFPNEPRFGRNVLIDESSFDLDPNGTLTPGRHPAPRARPRDRRPPRAHPSRRRACASRTTTGAASPTTTPSL
ncbi:MAG: hypothetical protein M5U09_27465 [Gammaproteobacteria bacterium]|nr:hypothetical protein [Gammaproteobacteria bacterium]